MCITTTYPTRGRGVIDPPPRRGNFTSHPPAGVMRLPRSWRRSDERVERVVEYRHSEPRVIEHIEEPRRSTHRARSVSRRRIEGRESWVEERTPRGSWVRRRSVRY
ncbi:hypothetical protein GQ44DRAFT_737980 [Phaeosphaeriaceae sp. PMI808]|nr:hypothetical protein GQ44DRAFT_737980 [Phaeosphaeriaceae sp. PMI808]